ncbi:hypothetical protein C1I99_31350, partial [Micromonospora deserti]
MTSPFEELIKSTLTNLAEETPAVKDQMTRVEGRIARRRKMTFAVAVASVAVAGLIATPLAVASTQGSDGLSPADKPAGSIHPSPIPTAVQAILKSLGKTPLDT